MIKIEKLHKSYPIGKDSLHVLKGIDLHIKEGEFVSIMGSSGSGKSTLLNIVGLLDGHDEGNYFLNGQLIKDLNEKKAAILRNKFLGFVFQSFNLISYKTALENVAFLRAQNGGVHSRLAFNAESLTQQKTNMRAALGRMVDVDIAEETTNLAKYSVLSQASASMLAQANSNTDIALMLLR